MKNSIILLSFLFFANLLAAQERGLKITDSQAGKEIILEENKRVYVKTKEGDKFVGRLVLNDSEGILVNGAAIKLEDISEISRKPLLTSAIVNGSLIYVGGVSIGIAAIAAVFVQPSALLITIPAGGLVYLGVKSPNIHKKYRNNGKWEYSILN